MINNSELDIHPPLSRQELLDAFQDSELDEALSELESGDRNNIEQALLLLEDNQSKESDTTHQILEEILKDLVEGLEAGDIEGLSDLDDHLNSASSNVAQTREFINELDLEDPEADPLVTQSEIDDVNEAELEAMLAEVGIEPNVAEPLLNEEAEAAAELDALADGGFREDIDTEEEDEEFGDLLN